LLPLIHVHSLAVLGVGVVLVVGVGLVALPPPLVPAVPLLQPEEKKRAVERARIVIRGNSEPDALLTAGRNQGTKKPPQKLYGEVTGSIARGDHSAKCILSAEIYSSPKVFPCGNTVS